eukprot:1087272-Karenia_brevis.AAC.1
MEDGEQKYMRKPLLKALKAILKIYKFLQDGMNINDFYTELAWETNNARNRKSVPSGEIPAEAWRTLFWPQWTAPGVR